VCVGGRGGGVAQNDHVLGIKIIIFKRKENKEKY
jgi:hypothetical protein